MTTMMQPVRPPLIVCDLQPFMEELQAASHLPEEAYALVCELLQEMFLTTVVAYERRLHKPYLLIHTLTVTCPHYETLFRQVTQPLRMIDLPDTVRVQITAAGLLLLTDPTHILHPRTLHGIEQHTAQRFT